MIIWLLVEVCEDLVGNYMYENYRCVKEVL